MDDYRHCTNDNVQFIYFIYICSIPLTSSSLLDIQLIVCGLGKIDINDWKSNTRLKHCTPDSNIVKWFWKAVESFDEERRARLLQFVTGSSRVPLQGFKALQGEYRRSICHLILEQGCLFKDVVYHIVYIQDNYPGLLIVS